MKGKELSPLMMVLPILNATNKEQLLEILNTYGRCVTFEDALNNPGRKERIVVGEVISDFDTYRDHYNCYGQVYHLKSIIPGDSSSYRFVACGKQMVELITKYAATGDYLALYEPGVMQSAADLTTFYFPLTKCTIWVCKAC